MRAAFFSSGCESSGTNSAMDTVDAEAWLSAFFIGAFSSFASGVGRPWLCGAC